MRILHAGIEDLAGMMISFTHAINDHTEHESRSIRVRDNYIHYEADIEGSGDAIWDEWIDWADVIHIHEYEAIHERIRRRSPKPVVWSIHGTEYRNRRRSEIDCLIDREHMAVFVSTPDLLLLRPDATWLPKPIPVEQYREYRHVNGRRLVVQTRTNVRKGTPAIPEGVDLDIVERVPHQEALTRKGKAWIAVDQIGPYALGIGVSGLESMAMGIPVLSGAPDLLLKHLRQFWGELPFLPTTPQELPFHVKELMEDEGAYMRWADRGSNHVKLHHDPGAVAKRLIPVYESALRGQQ